MELGLNILLSAPRGSGATSLLYRVEADHADRSVYVSLPAETSAETTLAAVVDALGAVVVRGDEVRPPGPIEMVRRQLERRSVDFERPMIALVDGPLPPNVAHELFGGQRDALYALPLTWVVVAPAERLGEYLAPPADVFFEHVVHLDPFSQDRQLDLLDRRGALRSLSGEHVDEIVRLGDGMPRRTLALAREALLHPHANLADAGYEDWLQRQAELSRSASMLFAEMQGREPVAANDPELLKRLGWGEMRARRAMQELVDLGLVRGSQGRTGGPGRPPTVYQPAPAPPGYQREVRLR